MYSLLWADGSISLVEVELSPHFDETGLRSVKHEVHTWAELPVEGGDTPLMALARRSEEGTMTFVKLLPANKISITQQTAVETLSGEKETKTAQLMIEEGIPGPISTMTMDSNGQDAFRRHDKRLLGALGVEQRRPDWIFRGCTRISRRPHDHVVGHGLR